MSFSTLICYKICFKDISVIYNNCKSQKLIARSIWLLPSNILTQIQLKYCLNQHKSFYTKILKVIIIFLENSAIMLIFDVLLFPGNIFYFERNLLRIDLNRILLVIFFRDSKLFRDTHLYREREGEGKADFLEYLTILFPEAATTKYHKLCGLKQQKFVLSFLWRLHI